MYIYEMYTVYIYIICTYMYNICMYVCVCVWDVRELLTIQATADAAGSMGDSQYSFSLTTFSPSGKLVQIEHALNRKFRALAGNTHSPFSCSSCSSCSRLSLISFVLLFWFCFFFSSHSPRFHFFLHSFFCVMLLISNNFKRTCFVVPFILFLL